ncbi:hypothetical protein CEUSTIGMA_g3560.t1 [Chlamydomonas eustigma]|uniref:Signal peptidase complex subunit 3 n=1 Tax=Chlamydomonas eustigma TaxID=1157962 RepID=A0A250WZ51_9CHLO|nr:hypothetical protein CEUSTIGMA_g3560.t1 [Chlamydomonas eustigma]|eukprot:GAX76117.1 hypothetical protein CEUSTIGMA_g3560.t1 [Chlamydomonas eustigma]
MHSLTQRANTVFTFFGSVAAVLAILTSCTDLFHDAKPIISLKLAEIKKLVPYSGSREQAVITFDLDADLRSVFSWNSKQIFIFVRADYYSDEGKLNQVVLWDSIIQQKEKAKIKLKKHKTKYSFIGHGKDLRGRDLNLTLVWDIMPRVGALWMSERSFGVGNLPGSYT